MKKILLCITLLLVLTLTACGEPETNGNQEENNNHLTNPIVTFIIEDYGTMVVELYPAIAPQTVNNFLTIATSGAYEGSVFHRVIKDFMIQGGQVDSTVCPIYGEFTSNGFDNSLLHERGVISMARTSVKNSATSQFFIMHVDYPFLDGNYAAFGQLTSGFDVLDAIALANTNSDDVPFTNIIIEEVTVDLDGFVLQDINCMN